ncbi:MAG TPA: membrane protein insertion efficiency factor YidD [Acidimicrobiales bacterium]|nr:membrane protein insertion efficiency factor YidD [Acidimicrobiales bacterium]
MSVPTAPVGSLDRPQRQRHPRPSAAVSFVLGCIRAYQLARSGRVSPCRFTPTCSQYAVEAVQRHGLRRGLGLTARRLGRCRPGGPFGFDPVPS